MNIQRFPSKVDTWLAVVLALPLGLMVVTTALLAQKGGNALFLGLGPLVFFLAILLLLVLPMHYDLEPTALLIRFGVVRQRIPYDRIDEAHPTRNPLSSPALSLDRLRIRYR